MSFFAAGSAIAGALGAGAVGSAVVGAGAAYVGNKLVNKAGSGSTSGSVGSIPNNPLDIDQVITDARNSAASNYQNSLALEAANNPGQAAFRNAATGAATNLVNQGPYQNTAQLGYSGTPLVGAYNGTAQSNALLNESADSILQQLRLGSSLPADVQSQITRAALSNAGQAGLSGSFAGRGLVARDIGTNSLALLGARQQAAQNAGSLLNQVGLGNAQFNLSSALGGLQADQLNLGAANYGLNQAQFNVNSAFQAKSLADAYALPNSGLDPGAIASLYVGNNNALNQTNQNQFLIDQQNANNRTAQLNKLLGFGSQAFASATNKSSSNNLGFSDGSSD